MNVNDKNIDKDPYLIEILKLSDNESVSKDFTNSVMDKISLISELKEKKIFVLYKNFKFWIIFGLTFSIIYISAYITSDGSDENKYENSFYEYFLSISDKIKGYFYMDLDISFSILSIITSLILLISVDTVLKILKNKSVYL